MSRKRKFVALIAMGLMVITSVGFIGCKSERRYDDDSMHAAEALTAHITGAVDIYKGKKIDLASDIFEATTTFNAEYGAFAHVSKELRDEFKEYLKKYLKGQTDGTEQKNPLYGISEEDWDEGFENAFPWKDTDIQNSD